MQAQTFVFIGPQGSGKGTQTDLLKEYLETEDTRAVLHLETGQAFRELAASETETGDRVADSMAAGDIQPTFLATELWAHELVYELTDETHLIVDGSPRTKLEAELLDEAFSFFHRTPVTVIHLTLPESVTYKRLAERARDDDHRRAIEHRLEQYRQKTLPIVDFYKTSANYNHVAIDGEGSIEEIQTHIQNTVT